MEYKDYYKTLGVPRDATQEAIKQAYRKLARKFHPDVSKEPNAEARFKEINEANEVLKDPEKRAAYNDLGNQWRAGQEFRPPPGRGGFHREFHFNTGGPGDAGGFSDFFSSLFGGGFGGAGGDNFGDTRRGVGARREEMFRQRGQDQTAHVEISLEEAFAGGTRELRLETPIQDGQGYVSSQSRTLKVRIPAGVSQGRQIRLAGQGQPGVGGGPAGDLYLEVKLKPHRLYQTDGRDILLHLPVAPWEAALGASVQVPTLGGTVTLKIPAGSQTGKRMRLKGRGLPGDPPGDQLVILEMVTPPADTAETKAFYQRMADTLAFDPRARLGG
ncbi:MAG: DnaJ domain-containing protein [Chromatiaceae bacterium]|nr:DnaJ domain-containing protein [Chromatiaceae bacterium]